MIWVKYLGMVCSLCSYYARRKIHNVTYLFIVLCIRMMYAVQMIIHIRSYKYAYNIYIYIDLIYLYLKAFSIDSIAIYQLLPAFFVYGAAQWGINKEIDWENLWSEMPQLFFAWLVRFILKASLKHHVAIFCMAKLDPVSFKTPKKKPPIPRQLQMSPVTWPMWVRNLLWHCANALLPIAWNPAKCLAASACLSHDLCQWR